MDMDRRRVLQVSEKDMQSNKEGFLKCI